jgi:integrase
LDNATELKTVAGDGKTGLKGMILEHCFKMERQGYAETTVRLTHTCLKVLMDRGANLWNSESVKEVMANQNWSQNRKRNVANAYTGFLTFLGLSWEPPRCKVTRKLPFIPLEKEIDELVAGCPQIVATMLQLLKETGARSGEAIKVKWKDVDFEKGVVVINEPEKGSDARACNNLTTKLMSMLKAMPRTNDYVFGTATMNSLKATFTRSRKRLAWKLQNPRLIDIHFHSLRHWFATMDYHKGKDLLETARKLGHREIKNTMLYIQLDKQLFSSKDDNYTVRIAHTNEEVKGLLEIGFEWVGEKSDAIFLRKPK